MTLRRLRPLSPILIPLLSLALATKPALGQDMLGDTTFSGVPNMSMPGGLNAVGGRIDMSMTSLPSIRAAGAPDSRAQFAQTPNLNLLDTGVRPLPPNDFQRFVLETSGQALPLFGASFFKQPSTLGNTTNGIPVAADYRVGPGDELRVRAWGSVDMDVPTMVDRDGFIHIPRVGAVNLVGARSAEAEGIIRAAIGKYYRDVHVSVTMGQLRGITVYVVGQARKPGAYSVSSMSTLVSALFICGGPNQTGSMRRIQVKRAEKTVTELDLYAFLSKGDKSADVKLQDGDTIVIPSAKGYVALTGKVPTPAVYELLGEGDSIGSVLALAGGLPVVADPKRAQLERLDPAKKPARSVEAFALDGAGLAKRLKNGDLLTISSVVPEFGNTVSLRGNVIQPLRSPWHQGMTVRDLIPNRAYLMSRASVKRQNDVMLSDAEKTRSTDEAYADNFAAMSGEQPSRNPRDPRYALRDGANLNDGRDGRDTRAYYRDGRDAFDQRDGRDMGSVRDARGARDGRDSRDANAAGDTADSLAQRVGSLVDEVNLDYAVIERVDSNNVSVKLLPFDLGKALDDPASPENLPLQPGDVLTVFSINDVRVPQAKRQVFVRVEGEVRRPGIYQMSPGDSLAQLLGKAGGLTPDAYLFGAAFFREEVRRAQVANLEQMVRKLEAQVQTRLSSSAASVSGTDPGVAQLRIQAEAQAQRQALERLRNIAPTGRIMLGLPSDSATPDQLPALKLENQDRLVVPSRPDFVYVLGSVNTESSLIWKEGRAVAQYLEQAGLTGGADKDEMFVIRADGSVLSNNGSWFNQVNHATVLPGDVIVLPEKTDHESGWSVFTRNAKDITQIVYQFSLGAAAIKTLRN